MATIKLTCFVDVQAGPVAFRIGTDYIPLDITNAATGAFVYDKSYSIPVATAVNLIDFSLVGMPPIINSLVFLLLITDLDVVIEFQGTTVADNSHLTLKGSGTQGIWGTPLILSSNQTEGYNAAGNFAGGSQSINRILAKNFGGLNATVRIVAIN